MYQLWGFRSSGLRLLGLWVRCWRARDQNVQPNVNGDSLVAGDFRKFAHLFDGNFGQRAPPENRQLQNLFESSCQCSKLYGPARVLVADSVHKR